MQIFIYRTHCIYITIFIYRKCSFDVDDVVRHGECFRANVILRAGVYVNILSVITSLVITTKVILVAVVS